MKRGNKPYSVTFESLVMRLVKQEALGRHARDSVSKMLWHYQTLC